MKILTISGSLRSSSSNSRLLRAAARLAPAGGVLAPFEGIDALPFFSPDRDVEPLPAAVVALRAAVRGARGVIISSPEYAHGVPGAMKNALDWLVSGAEIPGMPVALFNASPRSVHAQAQLAETLRTMSAVLVDEACIAVPLAGRPLDEDGIVADPEIAEPVRRAIEALATRAESTRPLADLMSA